MKKNKHKLYNIGTIYYNAPEIILEAKYNEKIDVWSICCNIYEMVTNKILFDIDKLNNDKYTEEHKLLLMINDIIGEIDGKIFQNRVRKNKRKIKQR